MTSIRQAEGGPIAYVKGAPREVLALCTRARLAGDPPDLLISPRVGQIGFFDFHRASDLIAHGARAAERAIDSIQEAIHILAPGAEPVTPSGKTTVQE